MSNPDEMQDYNQEQEYNNEGLGGNLVQEGSANYEGEQDQNQNKPDSNYNEENDNRQIPGSDHSFHMDKKFDDFTKGEKFGQRERTLNDQIDKILQGKGFSLSKFAGWIFWINKILLLTTFTEFLFQRFDIVTLFLCIVVILIELEIFTHKHLYIWLAVLVFSFILDAFVLIDIAPAGDTYLESGAGSTMLKFGLLILLINLFLKLILGIGLWKMAMNHKSGNTVEEGMQENQDNNDMLRDENTGRIFPGEGERNDMDLRESNHDIDQ